MAAPPQRVADGGLLDQWFKEEKLIAGRVAKKQSDVTDTRRSLTMALFIFLYYHLNSISHILFGGPPRPCHRDWPRFILLLLLCPLHIFNIRLTMWEKRGYDEELQEEKWQLNLLRVCISRLEEGGDVGFLVNYYAVRRSERRAAVTADKRWWSERNTVALLLLSFTCVVLVLDKRLCTVFHFD